MLKFNQLLSKFVGNLMDSKDNSDRKNYVKPILSEYGDIKEITLGDKCCPPDTHGAGQDSYQPA